MVQDHLAPGYGKPVNEDWVTITPNPVIQEIEEEKRKLTNSFHNLKAQQLENPMQTEQILQQIKALEVRYQELETHQTNLLSEEEAKGASNAPNSNP